MHPKENYIFLFLMASKKSVSDLAAMIDRTIGINVAKCF